MRKGLVTLQPSSCRQSRMLQWQIRDILYVDSYHPFTLKWCSTIIVSRQQLISCSVTRRFISLWRMRIFLVCLNNAAYFSQDKHFEKLEGSQIQYNLDCLPILLAFLNASTTYAEISQAPELVAWTLGQVENTEVRKLKYGNKRTENKEWKWEENLPIGV